MGDELEIKIDVDELVESLKANFDEPSYIVADRAQVKSLVEKAIAESDPHKELAKTQRYLDLIRELRDAGQTIEMEADQTTEADEDETTEADTHRYRRFPRVGENPMSITGDVFLEIAIRIACISPEWFLQVKRWTEKLIIALNKIYQISPGKYREILPHAVTWPVVMTPGPDSTKELHSILKKQGYGKATRFGNRTNVAHLNKPHNMLAMTLLRFVGNINSQYRKLPDRRALIVSPVSDELLNRILDLPPSAHKDPKMWANCCGDLFHELFKDAPEKFTEYYKFGQSTVDDYARRQARELGEAEKIPRYGEGIKKAIRQAVITLIKHDHHWSSYAN